MLWMPLSFRWWERLQMRLELPNKIADELNTGKTRFNFILDPDP